MAHTVVKLHGKTKAMTRTKMCGIKDKINYKINSKMATQNYTHRSGKSKTTFTASKQPISAQD
jgi:hypothetical protein